MVNIGLEMIQTLRFKNVNFVRNIKNAKNAKFSMSKFKIFLIELTYSRSFQQLNFS